MDDQVAYIPRTFGGAYFGTGESAALGKVARFAVVQNHEACSQPETPGLWNEGRVTCR